jgi:hypothetical protein
MRCMNTGMVNSNSISLQHKTYELQKTQNGIKSKVKSQHSEGISQLTEQSVYV